MEFGEDFAARADWCVKDYAEANHNPVVTLSAYDLAAKPGETVKIKGVVADVRPFKAKSWLYKEGCGYQGEAEAALSQDEALNLSFTVPADAKPGDYFNLILEARNEHENPMTGYGQAIVTVL